MENFHRIQKIAQIIEIFVYAFMVVVILDISSLNFLTLLKAKVEMSFLTAPISQHGSLPTSNFLLKFFKICELKSSELKIFQAMM